MDRPLFKTCFTALYFAAYLAANTLFHFSNGQIEGFLKILPIKCPFHLLTGIECPTCGLGRSLVLSFSGNWETAFTFHPLGPILFTLATLFTLALWTFPKQLKQTARKLLLTTKSHPKLFWTAVSAYVVLALAWKSC